MAFPRMVHYSNLDGLRSRHRHQDRLSHNCTSMCCTLRARNARCSQSLESGRSDLTNTLLKLVPCIRHQNSKCNQENSRKSSRYCRNKKNRGGHTQLARLLYKSYSAHSKNIVALREDNRRTHVRPWKMVKEILIPLQTVGLRYSCSFLFWKEVVYFTDVRTMNITFSIVGSIVASI